MNHVVPVEPVAAADSPASDARAAAAQGRIACAVEHGRLTVMRVLGVILRRDP